VTKRKRRSTRGERAHEKTLGPAQPRPTEGGDHDARRIKPAPAPDPHRGAGATGRTVKEWIGKTPDTPAPPRVKLRVLLTYDRKDYITGQPIRPGDEYEIDHIIAICNGGENRESNLAPVLVATHKEKTRRDRKAKQKADNIIKRDYGMKAPPARKIQGRGFQKTRKQRPAPAKVLPPKPLYEPKEKA